MSAAATSAIEATSTASGSSLADLGSRVSAAARLVTEVLGNPASNPLVALLVVLGIALVLVIVALLVWLMVVLVREIKHPREKSSQSAAVERRSARAVPVIWTLLVVALLAVVIVGWQYGTSDRTCARCHVTNSAFKSNAQDAHAEVSCRDCHIAPGPTGALAAGVTGVRNIKTQLREEPNRPTRVAHVDDNACLACHQAITEGVTTAGGIRMRHSDVLEVGYACTDCHNTAGHGESIRRVRRPQMAQCVLCHDGKKARSECDVCHTTDVGAAKRKPGAGYVKTYITPDGCRGCHSMQGCIECHGLELPHSQQFIGGYHAKKAYENVRLCFKCHGGVDFCNGCHIFGLLPSGLPRNPHDDFVPWHAKYAVRGGNACLCHGENGYQNPAFCDFCHGQQPSR